MFYRCDLCFAFALGYLFIDVCLRASLVLRFSVGLFSLSCLLCGWLIVFGDVLFVWMLVLFALFDWCCLTFGFFVDVIVLVLVLNRICLCLSCVWFAFVNSVATCLLLYINLKLFWVVTLVWFCFRVCFACFLLDCGLFVLEFLGLIVCCFDWLQLVCLVVKCADGCVCSALVFCWCLWLFCLDWILDLVWYRFWLCLIASFVVWLFALFICLAR